MGFEKAGQLQDTLAGIHLKYYYQEITMLHKLISAITSLI